MQNDMKLKKPKNARHLYVDVEYVQIESPYGDRFVIRDSYVNHLGLVVRLWHTVQFGHVAPSPDMYAADGYKILHRFTVPVSVR